MQIWIGLTNKELTSLDHRSVTIKSRSGQLRLLDKPGGALIHSFDGPITVYVFDGKLKISDKGRPFVGLSSESTIFIAAQSEPILVADLCRAGGQDSVDAAYLGTLRIAVRSQDKLGLSLFCPIETYMRGVLESEMPASYHPEALKCQAVAARTYALNPRIDHGPDKVSVCDSYLCCQYFSGLNKHIDPRIEDAIQKTSLKILTYQQKPILALFSACAGGVTEDFQNCFSDPISNAFPPAPIAYLKSVFEWQFAQDPPLSHEALIRYLYNRDAEDKTFSADAWNAKFRFKHVFTANQLEGQMHFQIEKLRRIKDNAPFIVAPPSNAFGLIKKFEPIKRSAAGTLIELGIHTSKGTWIIKKELVIRSVFANPQARIKRLPSAKIFFEHRMDLNGLLAELSVMGTGSGHGVGLQQIGAHGHAKNGLKYEAILRHYYPGAILSSL